MRNVLKVCLDKGVSSIAIPSLGAGNLGYPHHVVADVMFNEVRIFNSQHPSFFKEIIFILTERKVYESFMKVYAQQLCDSSTKEVSYFMLEMCLNTIIVSYVYVMVDGPAVITQTSVVLLWPVFSMGT